MLPRSEHRYNPIPSPSPSLSQAARPLRGLQARATIALRIHPLVILIQPEAESLDLHRPDALLKRLLERPPDRHRFADALHLRRQRFIRIRKFLKRPPRNLDDAVID